MNKIYTVFIAILLLTLFNVNGFSQCTWGGWTQYPSTTQSTSVSTWTTVSTATYAGEYGVYNVTSGSTYEWSLCSADGGSCSYSGNLTMFDGTTNAVITSASANCGNDSKITWTATFTGTVKVLITQAACTANSTFTTIVWRCSTCGSSAPVNDLCSSPTVLTVGTSCSSTAGTTANATQSLAGCVGTANDDVWYSFVATSSTQNISVVGASSFDAVVQVFSGTCAALSSITCVDNTVDGGTESTTITGMTVGNTYLIRVYDYGSDVSATPTFTICVYGGTGGGGTPTTGDCLGAIKVCQNTYSYANTVTGIGNVDDLGVVTSCGTYEKNATWYLFTVNSSGIFRFTLNSSIDYDWALYNLTGASCDQVLDGTLSAIRCNYSATTGNTGMNSTATNTSEGASGSVWCSQLNVTAGQTFALLVDNYNGGAVGYDLDFSTGTAGIFDGTPPYLYSIETTPACGDNTITVNFSEVVDINSVDASDFTLVSGSTSYSIISATGVNGTANDQTYNLVLNTALTSGGTFTLSLVGQVKDACNNATSTSSLGFTVTGVSANVTSTNPTCYNGTNGTATSNASGGTAPYTYSWSTGATTSSVTGLGVGTYTVTVRDNNGAGPCQDIQSVTISNNIIIFEDDFDPSPVAGWTTGAISGTNSWTTGQPLGGKGDYSISNPDPTQDHSLNASNMVYGQRLGSGTAGGYNNSSNDWLKTKAIDCTGKTGITLSFWRWANFEPNYDEAYVEVSTNNSTWTSLGHPIYPQDNVWTYVSYDISAYANNQATVYIRWRSDNDVSTTYSGWNIDDVVVTCSLIPITGTTVVTNVKCFGNSTGAIDLTPTGGSGTYTGYSWTGGATTQDISSKPAGIYTVTITDNGGCTGNVTATITQPASALSLSLGSQTNVLCYGNSTGAIDINVSNGTPGYTYSWTGPSGYTASSQDLTSRPAGTYNVTVTDANLCTATASYTITQPASGISVALTSQTNVSCFGGSNGAINITATGGIAPYTYNWGGGVTSEDRTGLSAGVYSVTVSDNSGGGCTGTLSVTITQPASGLSVSVTSQTNVSCFGGSNGAINITASGGTTSYTYNWGGGITSEDRTGLGAGTYTVTVTDANSCTASVSATITQPASALSASIVGANVSCNSGSNGTADLTPSNGTPGYTYNWGGGITTQDRTGLVAGTYIVTVTDANSCTTTASVTITQPNALIVSMSKTDAMCNGASDGTATATPSGGTSGYTYHWDDASFQSTQTAIGLASGTYNVTVTDVNSCTATGSVIVNQPVAVSISTSSTQSVCSGSSGTATATINSGGATPFDYNWSNLASTMNTASTTNTINSLASGSYTVTVTDNNGCTATSTTNVTDAAGPSSNITAQTNVSCNGVSDGTATVTISGGTANFTYIWDGGAPVVNALTTNTASGLSAGVHSVVITDNFGCSTSSSVTITQPAVLNASITAQTNVLCNGNSTASATVSISGGTANYNYNWPAPITDANNTPALSNTANNISAGTYVITVTDSKSCSATATVTITEPTSLSASIAGTNVSCFGASNGSADLTPAGGTLPYIYLWTGGSTNQDLINISQGTYFVTVTDANGCTATSSVVITQPGSALSVNMTSTNITCFGLSNGTATANLVGGTSPYNYIWSNSGNTQTISGLTAATYAVTVTDANSCIGNGSVTLTQPSAALQGTISSTNINCFGQSTGAVNLTVTGGTTAYSYSWTGPSSFTSTSEDLTLRPAGTYNVTITDANSCTTTASVILTEPVSSLSASISGTNVGCFGGATGEADLTVSGGTPSYTYLWSNASTNQDLLTLTANTYSVTVTDSKGCQINTSVIISQPASALSSSIVGTNITCSGSNNGIANLTVSGGTSPYTYLWGGGQTTEDLSSLSSGSYSVTVTDFNSCTSSATVAITEPAVLNVTASKTNVSCNGLSDGQAVASAAGGTSPYTYLWTGGQTASTATGLAFGTYTVTVTDANMCTGTATVTITQPAVLTSSIVASDVSCNGLADASADLSVSGGNIPYNYLWSTGYTNQDLLNVAAGIYSVTITDNKGCTSNNTVTLSEPTTMLTTITGTNVACRNGLTGSIDVTVSGGVTPYSYSWNTGQVTEDLVGIVAGNYSGTISDSNGCNTTVAITITQPAAVLSVSSLGVNVNCNGASTGSINLTVNGGTTPYTYNWSNAITTEDQSGLAAGIYTVTVTDANLCTVSSNVTINQPAALTTNIVTTNVLCNGALTGLADLTVSGGNSPYSFTWSNSSSLEDLSNVAAGIYNVTITDFKGCQTTASTTITEPSLIVLSTSSTNSTCGSANGTATVNISGGISPYTIDWNGTPTGDGTNNIINLASGAYAVSVVDANGCIKTSTVNVNDAGAPVLSISSQTNVDCNGNANGAVSVSVTGGVSPFTYTWSIAGSTNAQTNLSGGVYDVTVVDANNCSANLSATITEPATLSASITGTNINCNGGSNGIADLTVSGGTTPYSYLWSNTDITQDLTNITAGIYSTNVTDANSCSVSASVTITEPAAVVATITSSTNATASGVCDGTVTVGVIGGTTPYSYTWSNSQTTASLSGLCAGIYNVTVIDSKGCTSTTSVTITEPGSFSLSYTQTNILCYGLLTGAIDLTVNGGTTPYTYNWSNLAGSPDPEDQTGLAAGTYTVTVTDANSYSTQTTVIITQPSNLTSSIVRTNVACFGGSTGALDLTVSGGVTPYAYIWSNAANTQDISGLIANVYTVTITDNNGCQNSISSTITEPSAAVSATFTVTDVSCFNNSTGIIDVTPSGGTLPYSYIWSSGQVTQDLSGVLAGNYDLTITDYNLCTFNLSATITEPATGLTIDNIIPTDALCYNGTSGSADLILSGGTSPFTYNWSYGYTTEDLTNVIAGVYDVTVTDNNLCYALGSVTIGQPANPIVITSSQTNSTCGNSDGTATISVTGGTVATDYIYDWAGTPVGDGTTSISALGAGTYVVTVTDDNACTKVSAVYISDIGGVNLSIIKLSDIDCNGNSNGSAMAVGTGGTTPYTYNWSTGGNTDTEVGLSAGTVTLTLTDAVNCVSIDSVTIIEPNALILSNVTTDVSCFGTNTGSIDLTVTGGTAPYSYTWFPNASTQDVFNLVAGNYDVTVTDAKGCTSNLSFIVNEPSSELSVSGIGTNVSCYGLSDGSIDITTTGGTTPYNYYWNYGQNTEDINGLFATTYSVTVIDANLCEANANITITQPTNINLSIVSTEVLCNGDSTGTAIASVFGGATPYTYLWNDYNSQSTNTLVNVPFGSYSLTVTDANGCMKIGNVLVNQPDSISISAINKDVKCFGQYTGSIQLIVTGGKVNLGYNYAWDNGDNTSSISYLNAGTYCVSVSDDNGCITSTCVNINEPASPLSVNSTISNVNCFNGIDASIDLTTAGGVSPYTYLWNYGQLTEDINNLSDGIYTVTITDNNGCKLTQSFNVIQPISAINSVVNKTNSTCGLADGTATVTAVGGTSPYTYLWSNGDFTSTINGLGGGIYNVTITDNNGCTKIDSATIIQPAVLSSVMTPTNNNCYGASNGSITLTTTGGTGNLTYAWNVAGATTAALINKPAGTYCVTITDANGCTFDSCAIITEPTDSILLVASSTNINCYAGSDGAIDLTISGGTTFTTGDPYMYLWNNGQTTEDLTGLSVGSHTITVTDANGCKTSATFNITQPAASLLTSITKVNSTCENDNGIASVFANGGTTPYSYLWEDGTTNDSIIDLAPGQYNITVTDANGCTKLDSVTIVDLGNPIALILNKVNVSCNGGSDGFATVFAANGASPITYIWNNGAVTPTATGLSAGTYNVTITDGNGCQDSTSTVITDPALLVVVPTISDALCYGDTTGQIYAAVTGGTPSYTYLWGGGENSAIISNLVSGTYTVTITDSKGCTADTSITISQPLAPLSSIITTNNTTCYGAKDADVFLAVSGGTPNYKFIWNYGQTNDTLFNILPGSYIVTITDANQCTLIDSITVTQPDPLSISWTSVESHCGFEDGSATLDTITGGTAPYSWIWSNGQTDSTATGLAFGAHDITVTDSNGCIKTFDFNINFVGSIPVTAGATQIRCYGLTGSVVANVGAGYPPFDFTFYKSDSTIIGLTTSYSDSVVFSNVVSGSYFILVTDSVGCQGSAPVNIAPQPSDIVAYIVGTDVRCKGENNGSAVVHASGGRQLSGASPYYYYWTGGLSTDSTITNLQPITSYYVTVTDANGCTEIQEIMINEPEKVISVGVDTIVPVSCFSGHDGMIQVEGIGGNGSYVFNWSNGQGTPTAFSLVAGNYTVSVTDIKGCSNSTILIVTQPEIIAISNVSTNTSCRDSHDGVIELTVTGGVGNYTYLWNTQEYNTSYVVENLYADDYVVSVTDANSCMKIDTITVNSEDVECLEIPSCFTPNGDGINDIWEIKNIDLYPEVKVEIYNRWGNILFKEEKGYFGKEWDGTFNGQLAPAASYVYILTFPDGKVEPKTGVVTIIR